MRWDTHWLPDGVWQRWFAWHPVPIAEEPGTRRWVWLEEVERKRHRSGPYTVWYYRSVKGVKP
jgi:hypothetical protein